MSTKCCHVPQTVPSTFRYKRVLWAVLANNAAMFFAEAVYGITSGSVSLQADALDFLGDSANYGISLSVAGMALGQRSRAALLKGASMGCFGIWVAGSTAFHAMQGTVPEADTMGIVGLVALAANALSFALLWSYRSGDSNMQSVWLCTRNDVIGNLAVLLAALGVFGTSKGWPDLVVAAVMAGLALQGSWVVGKSAARELAGVRA